MSFEKPSFITKVEDKKQLVDEGNEKLVGVEGEVALEAENKEVALEGKNEEVFGAVEDKLEIVFSKEERVDLLSRGKGRFRQVLESGDYEKYNNLLNLVTKEENGGRVYRKEDDLTEDEILLIKNILTTAPPLPLGVDAAKPDPIPDPTIPRRTLAESEMAERERREDKLSIQRVSKEILAEERKILAKELWESRRLQRERLKDFKAELDAHIASFESIAGEELDTQYGQMLEKQSLETEVTKERLESMLAEGKDFKLSAEEIGEEKDNLTVLIENSERIGLAKEKLKEHYEKASEVAERKRYEEMQRTVEETMKRNNAFFVHVILTDQNTRHNENSNVSKRATFEDDLDILLSLEPSISTSTFEPGTVGSLWGGNNYPGVLLGGGKVSAMSSGDHGSESYGIKDRWMGKGKGVKSVEGLDSVVTVGGSYNELIVDDPKVVGFFKRVEYDKNGALCIPEGTKGFLNGFKIASKKGLPLFVMSPDRKVYEFLDIDEETGVIRVGGEVTPEQIANSKAGLSAEKRIELGNNILDKHLFVNIGIQKEAREIIYGLSDENKEGNMDFSRQDYIDYVLKNKSFSQRFGGKELPDSLKNDKDFFRELLKNDIKVWVFFDNASENLKNDKEFVLEVFDYFDQQYSIYYSIPESLKGDRDVVLKAIDVGDIRDLGVWVKGDKELFEKYLDKIVGKMNMEDVPEFREYVYSLQPSLIEEGRYVSIEDEVLASDYFWERLSNKNPDIEFSIDEWNQLCYRRKITEEVWAEMFSEPEGELIENALKFTIYSDKEYGMRKLLEFANADTVAELKQKLTNNSDLRGQVERLGTSSEDSLRDELGEMLSGVIDRDLIRDFLKYEKVYKFLGYGKDNFPGKDLVEKKVEILDKEGNEMALSLKNWFSEKGIFQ